MGKNDVALSSYFSDPQIFADLFNAWMYGGRQVIAPESLTAEDPVQPRPEYARPYKHVRDVVKMYQKDGVQLVLLGIENQEKIDYSAPVRILQFDSADYQNQVRRTEEENRKRMGLKTGLPAFFREDRIIPVITLILYFGEEEWDRPVRLHDMLAFPEGEADLRPLVPDYPIHVISVRRSGAERKTDGGRNEGHVSGMDISLLRTELRQVFGFLQHQEDKEGLKRYVEENRAVFSHISSNGALFLAASAHETRLLKDLNREEEHYDMCRALDEWYADGVNEGKAIGEKIGEKRGEKRGEERGEKKGIYKGLSSALLRILERKGSVPESCLTYISAQKDMDRLNQLLDLALSSETVADFEKKAGILAATDLNSEENEGD